jgi:hypothetical protein
MFCYPFFKIVGMASVVRIIGAAKNVNPETHFLLFFVSSLPNFSAGSTYLSGALRQCSGRTEFSMLISLISTPNPEEAKLEILLQYSITPFFHHSIAPCFIYDKLSSS